MKKIRPNLWKIILIGSGMLAVFVIICLPIYYYILYFGNNNPSSNPSDWGPFGDFFGGILNPIISFFTLLVTIYIAFYIKKIEDKRADKAIESSYKPDLIIEERLFYIASNSLNDIPLEFSYDKIALNYRSSISLINSFHLKLLNIGLGPAKKIILRFSIDLDKIHHLVNISAHEAGNNDKITASYDIKKPQIFQFTQNIGGNSFRSMNVVQVQNESRINHILSIEHNVEPYQIDIPHYILEAYSALIFNSWNSVEEKKQLFDLPVFSIELIYADIGNKVFSKKFEISIAYLGGTRNNSINQIKVNDIELSIN